MATQTRTTLTSHAGYAVEVSDHTPGRILPQKIGRALWLPMLGMALMAFPVALILGAVRANEIATGGADSAIAALGHFVPAVMFIGFASVFSAISFAIARILGELRVGGGQIQEAAGRKVLTMQMPLSAKIFIGAMAMAMMTLVGAVVLHFIAGAAIAGESSNALGKAEQWGIWLEAARRFGVALYLVAIAFGLASIIRVLRFQAIRVNELPDEERIAGLSA